MKQVYHDSFELSMDEYVITAEHISAKDYEIKYKGKILKDVIAIIRKGVR